MEPSAFLLPRAFVLLLFHFFEDVGAVFDFFPDFVGNVDGGGLLDRHGDAVAWAAVEFNDLAGVQFVFGADDEAGEVGFAFEVVDDDALHFCPHSSEEMTHEIVGEGAFLWGLVHEHRNGGADAFVDVNDEDLLLVPDKDCATVIVGKDGANRYRDDLFHEAYVARALL